MSWRDHCPSDPPDEDESCECKGCETRFHYEDIHHDTGLCPACQDERQDCEDNEEREQLEREQHHQQQEDKGR